MFSFHRKEDEYEQWLKENLNGFVFNYFGTAEMNKLHHAGCFQLHMLRDLGSRTNYEKICSTNYFELENEANRITKNEWSKCKSCFK
jgi:hypothetical protein